LQRIGLLGTLSCMVTLSACFSRFMCVVTAAYMIVGLSACAKTIQKPEWPKPVAGGVRFVLLAPEAKKVALVGSFNGWAEEAIKMKMRDGTGFWSVDVPLKVGEYTFMYLVDGTRWVTPPAAEDFVTDGFGQTNGVVIVH
jgi:1,4-alpha-glucan branching enzyme